MYLEINAKDLGKAQLAYHVRGVSGSFPPALWDIVSGAFFTYFTHSFPVAQCPAARKGKYTLYFPLRPPSLAANRRTIRGRTSTYSVFNEPNSTVHYRMLGAPGTWKYPRPPTMAAHSNQKVEWVGGAGLGGTLSSASSFNPPVVFQLLVLVLVRRLLLGLVRTRLLSHSLLPPLPFFSV